MTFRDSKLKFGSVRGIEGHKVLVKASELECSSGSESKLVEVGSFVNCGGLHGDTVCLINKIQIDEIEKKNKKY